MLAGPFSMFSSRRGEETKPSAAGAAILVLLIALLVILFVLFLPPDERCALLENCDSVGLPGGPGGPGMPGTPQPTTIYSASPGDIQQQGPEIYRLPSFEVRTITSGSALTERSGLEVQHSVFHNSDAQMSFALPQSADNLMLSFSVVSAQGNLQIDLNGERIYDAPLNSRQPAPISLPSSLLMQSNQLTFSVSGVGFSFWDTNSVSLSNVRVTGDVTDFAQAQQTQRFVMPDLQELHRVSLNFVPDCPPQAQGRMSVSLNGAIIYSGLPQCRVPLSFDIAKSRLRSGENALTFDTSQGAYYIDQLEVVAEREQNQNQFRFTISQELLSRALAENRPISLELTLTRPGAEGRMLLNGRELAYRTHRTSFSGSIMSYVTVGENTIEFTSSTAPIHQLRVLYG